MVKHLSASAATRSSRLATSALALAFAAAAVGGGACVKSTNPFDPDTPREFKARGSVSGSIQAVVSLAAGEIIDGVPGDGETLVEAAFCDVREGNHEGFEVVLRELDTAADAEARVGRSNLTTSTGSFLFDNVIPGDYTLEILRPGFRTPPPRTITVGVGETVALAPLCAINSVGPERPALAPLPPVVNGDNLPPEGAPDATPPVVAIQNCDESVAYTISQVPEGVEAFDADSTTVRLSPGEGCSTPLLLADIDGARARRSWRIEVVAQDALGNKSEAATAFVIRDTSAPTTPDNVEAVPSLDRFLVRWQQPPAVGLDDGPTTWRVSYGLTARPEDAEADCPFGAPGDGFDVASFAVEGPSPVTAVSTQLSLTGILPGTNVAVQVAAVDAVGNTSCYAAPLFVRPDEITFALEREDDVGVAAARVAHFRGYTAWARGAGGLQIATPDGTVTTIGGLVANDVSAIGRTFLASGGPGGLHVVTIPADGSAPTAASTTVGDTLNAVLARPGLGVVGTATGVRFLPIDDPTSGGASVDPGARGDAVTRILGEGALLFLARADGRVQAVDRRAAATEIGAIDDEGFPPTSAVVFGDELWLAYGDEGVRAVDFSACDLGAADCLAPRFDVEMPGAGEAAALAVWDDRVLVAINNAGLLGDVVGVLRPVEGAAPRLVGLAFLPDGFGTTHLIADELGFCALNASGRACFRSATQLLAEREQVFTAGGPVLQATVDDDSLWLLSTRGPTHEVQQHRLDGSVARRARMPEVPANDVAPFFPAGPARLSPAPPLGNGAGYATVDNYGRLVHVAEHSHSSDADVVDTTLPARFLTAAPATALPGVAGVANFARSLVDLDGGRLVVLTQPSSSDDCNNVQLSVVRLVEDADGALRAADVVSVDLEPVRRIVSLTVEAGVAYVGSAPFRVDAVDLDAMATTASTSEVRSCNAADAGVFGTFGVQPQSGPGGRQLFVGGTFDLSGPVVQVRGLGSDGALEGPLPLRLDDEVAAIGVARDLLTVAFGSGGAVAFRLPAVGSASTTTMVPAFAMPSVRDVQSIQPTARGVVIADGANGAVWHPLR